MPDCGPNADVLSIIKEREDLERLAAELSEKLKCIVSIDVYELPEAEGEESDEDA